MSETQKKDDVFANPDKYALDRPRDKAWDNWAKFTEVGDQAQGYIRDVFYRAEDGQFKAQRGITLEQPDGKLINVAVKRMDFILAKTDNLRLGDPLTVRLDELKPAQTKGYSPTKVYGFYGKNLEENKEQKTVKELDEEDKKRQDLEGPDQYPASGEADVEYEKVNEEATEKF